MRGGMVRQGNGKPVALSTTCQGECSSGGPRLTFKCGQKRPPGVGTGIGTGVGRECRVWSIEYRGSDGLLVGPSIPARPRPAKDGQPYPRQVVAVGG